jgi:hypothetical protein
MKKMLFIFLLSLSTQLFSQEFRFDSEAILILDKMSSIIGELSSCGFTLNTSVDQIDVELDLIKQFAIHQVYMVGPDKMLVNSRGEKGHRGFWYNGKQLAYYSYTENNYAVIDAPSNIIATIDTVNKTYGIDFPAADFFYPSFTDDLIDNNDEIIFVGKSIVNDKDCFHIIAKNKDMSTQIWISDDALFLPVKMVIVYYDVSPNEQYEATFSDWQINPEYPNAMFEFAPPASANKLKLIAK